VDRHHEADGALRVRVGLEWGHDLHQGRGEGMGTREGTLRAGAEAALAAARSVTGGSVHLELAGIKAVRAFDSWLVVSSVVLRDESGLQRRIGARAAPDGEMAVGAVLSVLDALNRVLTPYLPPNGD
jgi:hypothetical protein